MPKKTSWLPAGKDIVPEPEFCPDSIIKYAQLAKKRPPNSLLLDVRKHLSYFNWKIEFAKDPNIRLRYTSPDDGKQYYSLRDVCSFLGTPVDKIFSSSMQQHDHQEDPNFFTTCPDFNSLEGQNSLFPHQEYTSNLPQPQGQISSVRFASNSDDDVFIEPEYCPEAILEWYRVALFEDRAKIKDKKGFVRERTLRAKKHLSALGWSFRYVIHCGRRELRYVSPQGKQHNSLRVACQTCINSTAKKTVKKKIVEEEQSDLSEMDLPKLENVSTKSSCIPKLRRKPQKPKPVSEKFQSNMRKRRKTRRFNKRVQQAVVGNRSPLTILTWLVDNNVVVPREKVYYCIRNGSPPIAKGQISSGGIKCNCCGTVFTLSGFEFHASGNCGTSAASIFLKDGRSLLDCQLQAVHNQMNNFTAEGPERLKNSRYEYENDDICSVCHYGGELMLCDQCPSSFHRSCLGLMDVPVGDWFCPSCCCRICCQNKLKRDIRHSMDDDNNVLNCTQCEHKYHVGCLTTKGEDSLEHFSGENWFCSKKCKEIFFGLHELLGKPVPVGLNNLTWTLLKLNPSYDHIPDASDIENYINLNLALEVMHECFEPVEEGRTREDIVKDVIFSKRSELNRLNFGGFYTVVLQKNGELITVATVRVYGEKVAEIPLVGTRVQYRRLGMCGILMDVLEKKLKELGVERLILPAVPSVLNTWTGTFGFSKITESERLHFLDYTFLDFQDTIMCHKLLMEIPCADSTPSTEVRHADASENDGNIDLNGPTSVLEAHIIGAEIVEHGLLPVCARNSNSSSEGLIDSVMMNPGTDPGEVSLECSAVNIESNLKCYKRRRRKKILACAVGAV